MLDAKTQKALKKQYGVEVSQGSTAIAMMADKAPVVNEALRNLLHERNLPDVEIKDVTVNNDNFLIVSKNIQRTEKMATVLQIESYGNDLLIDIRHFELSGKAGSKRSMWGSAIFSIGLLSIFTGVGLLAVIWGGWLAFVAKSEMPEGSAERQASQQLYETVMETVVVALDNCEVSARAQLSQQFDF